MRKHLLESIKRQLNAEAAAVDAPSPPSIKVVSGAEAVYNDPEVTARLVAALRRDLGPDSAVEMPAKMTSEDFSPYGRAGVRAVLLHIGAVNGRARKWRQTSRSPLPKVVSRTRANAPILGRCGSGYAHGVTCSGIGR